MFTLIVRDYDEAIDWFQRALGFSLSEDVPVEGKRWVVLEAPYGGRLMLARASDEAQTALIGRQFAGRVGLFLHVPDFNAAIARMRAENVEFESAPRREPYGHVTVFRDLYGNRWDLIQPA